MKIVIFGSGGVGGYFGARLAAAGNDVTFVARGAHFEAMRSLGLRVVNPLGDVSLPEVEVVNRVAQIKYADFVFLTVKLWDTQQAIPELVPLAERGAAVISFQNGVQKEEVLLRVLPKPSVMGGVSYISAAIQEPGVIRHFGPIQNLVFGEFDGAGSQRALELLSACESARIGARISNEIEREIWEKFVFLVGLSATTATMRQPIGAIRTNEQTRGFLLDVMRETVNVGRARGVTLAKDYADQQLEFCDTLPAEMTASMYQDLLRGNRLELPWLSASVAELGEKMGIPVPRNRAVTDILALYVAGHKSD
ncbi:2-dehydropantoate 2-reductase [Alloacidobacterium dinghuense]|uniref:2-dehydropantoate 2-reductase n=1 Tax=Alloacidobacterium dinghuense TaxID=2763107 RepID=A0A7G8BQA9_9BACT|nr:2-dehydropantoate 2-reductase [Alloacidobacterium dinghuense]